MVANPSFALELGVLEKLSQGAHYLATGGGCQGFDQERASTALKQISNCQDQNDSKQEVVPQASVLADLTKKISEPAEDQFFALLAKQHARELDCSAQFADEGVSKNQESLKDISKKIRMLREAKQKLVRATREVAENPQAITKSCPLGAHDLIPSDSFCKEVVSWRSAYNAIYASIPLSEVPSVKKLLESEANAAQESTQLENAVKIAYADAKKFLADEGKKLRSKAQQEGGKGFDRNARYALLSDPRVTSKVIEDGGNSADLKNLVCRADARYGSGADQLQTGLFVGSMLLGGASGVVTRIGSAAWKVAEGANAARSAGLLSLNATRILQISAIGVNGASAWQDAARACGDAPVSKFIGSCVGAPNVQQLEQDNCYLAQALIGLQIAGTGAPIISEFKIRKAALAQQATKSEAAAANQAKELSTPPANTQAQAVASQAKGINSVPKVQEYPFPAGFQKELLSDPNVKEMQEMFGTGKNLRIVVTPDVEMAASMAPGQQPFSGELIQSKFVGRSLKTIFPDAEVGGPSVLSKAERTIELHITDSAEMSVFADMKSTNIGTLEMAKLKMANPGVGPLDKSAMRTKLGIPQDSRVLSINNSLSNEGHDVEALIKAAEVAKPDIMIINIANENILKDISSHLRKTMSEKYKIIRMSELDGKPLKDTKDVIILNDTFGKMHSVYATADVNVTAGAVNMAEPLLMKTPTVFFDQHSKYMHGYDEKAFSMMAKQATRTGGAEPVSNLREMGSKVKSLMDSPTKPEIRAPYNLQDATGVTPLNRFTHDLKDQLILQSPGSDLMKNVLDSPGGKKVYLKMFDGQVDEINKGLSSFDSERQSYALFRLSKLKIPENTKYFSNEEILELRTRIDDLRKSLLKEVEKRSRGWDRSAKALIDLEKRTPASIHGKLQNGLTEESASKIRNAVGNDKSTAYLLHHLDSQSASP